MAKNEIGNFGKIYTQFNSQPKKAIKHLMMVKDGECVKALYRSDIGFIDIVWGENDVNNKGYGLKHIIEKHGNEIEQLGFKVEDFIPIIVQFGEMKPSRFTDRITLESKMFRVVISKVYKLNGKPISKTFVLTAFDLRPLAKKNR